MRVGDLPHLLAVVAPDFFGFTQTPKRVVRVALLPLLDRRGHWANEAFHSRDLARVLAFIHCAGRDIHHAILVVEPLHFTGPREGQALRLQAAVVSNVWLAPLPQFSELSPPCAS